MARQNTTDRTARFTLPHHEVRYMKDEFGVPDTLVAEIEQRVGGSSDKLAEYNKQLDILQYRRWRLFTYPYLSAPAWERAALEKYQRSLEKAPDAPKPRASASKDRSAHPEPPSQSIPKSKMVTLRLKRPRESATNDVHASTSRKSTISASGDHSPPPANSTRAAKKPKPNAADDIRDSSKAAETSETSKAKSSKVANDSVATEYDLSPPANSTRAAGKPKSNAADGMTDKSKAAESPKTRDLTVAKPTDDNEAKVSSRKSQDAATRDDITPPAKSTRGAKKPKTEAAINGIDQSMPPEMPRDKKSITPNAPISNVATKSSRVGKVVASRDAEEIPRKGTRAAKKADPDAAAAQSSQPKLTLNFKAGQSSQKPGNSSKASEQTSQQTPNQSQQKPSLDTGKKKTYSGRWGRHWVELDENGKVIERDH